MHPTGYRQKSVPIKSFIMGEGKNQVKHVDGREKDPPSKWTRRWPQTALRGELREQITVPPKGRGQNVE